MSEDHDGFSEGQDQHALPPPLTAEERKVLESLAEEFHAANRKYQEWLREAGTGEVSREITFRIRLSGERLKRFQYMRLTGVEAGNISAPDFVRKLIEFGIDAFYDALVLNHIQNTASFARLATLPPELQEAAITGVQRRMIRQYMAAKQAGDPVLREMTRLIQPEAAPRVPVDQFAQGAQGDQPREPGCGKCGKDGNATNPLFRHTDGKHYHADCLIDVVKGG